jgi:THO complex subunit 4
VQLLYDRQDRSRGTAFVTYHDVRDARDAIRDYDGANANGQPIHLTLVPIPSAPKQRNPFDTAERPSRSLFDRIESPADVGRSRSDSPRRNTRRSDVRRPAPEGIDRYIPGEGGDSRRRSPMPRRGDGGRRGGDRGDRGARRPGERRTAKETDGHPIVQGRPRKTQEELDAEMEDYWGSKEEANKQSGTKADTQESTGATTVAGAGTNDDDIDMIQ